MNIRASKKHQNDIYLQDIIGVDYEGNEVRVVDKIADENDSIDEQVDLKLQIKQLYQVIKRILKGREKQVIEMRYGLLTGNERTQREVAEVLNISRSYVSRIEKKALKKLFKELRD